MSRVSLETEKTRRPAMRSTIVHNSARVALLLATILAFTSYGQAQMIGGRMSSIRVPEEPAVTLPSNQPTFLTTINYPLVYGAYAVWPYAIPVSFDGSGLAARPLDMSMRPVPVVTKAYAPSL